MYSQIYSYASRDWRLSIFSGWPDEPEEDESVLFRKSDTDICEVDINPVQLHELKVIWAGLEEGIQRTAVPFTKYSNTATTSSKQEDSLEIEETPEKGESLVNYSEPATTTN